MSDKPLFPSRIPSFQTSPAIRATQMSRYALKQEMSETALYGLTDSAFNPLAIARRFETLDIKRRRLREEQAAQSENIETQILEVTQAEEISEQYQRKNPELSARALLVLKTFIERGDTKEEILRKVLANYPDYSLADEVLDFLLETSDPTLSPAIRGAKEDLNALFGREVRAGRNISAQAREFSAAGLGSPTMLRNMYREIIGNPREAFTLFDELTGQFPYEKMATVIDFMLHSLGSDLKSKGPSIARGELHRLMTETRQLQAILGICKFFKSRMKLLMQLFEKEGLELPSTLSFEYLTKQFIRLLQERYPSADKALLLALEMGIGSELEAQLIIYAQFRDAVRQTSPRLFKSEKHRQDVLMMFIEALEELEEQTEEEEEKET